MPSRRDLLATLGAGAALGIAGCAGRDCTPAEPTGLQWPQRGGGPRNTNAAPDRSLPARVGERWRAPLAPDDTDLLAFAGAAVDDRIVGAGRVPGGGVLGEYEFRDGEQGMRIGVPARIASPPVVASGFTALAFDTDDGSALRLYHDGVEAGRYAIGDAPATPRAVETTLFGGDADGAYAYDVTGQEERWRHDFGDEREGGAVPFSPAVDDWVYVAVTSSSDRGIYALDRFTGDVEWAVRGPRAARAPALTGSLLLVPGEGELLALDAETGERRWSTPTPADRRAFHSPAGDGDRLAVSDGSSVHALARETGKFDWSVGVDGARRPLVVGDAALVSGDAGVVALELEDGSERWRIEDVSLLAPLENGLLVRRDDELVACTACEN